MEIFKPVPGYEGKYEISSYGNLFCLRRNGIDGRWQVNSAQTVNRRSGKYAQVFLYSSNNYRTACSLDKLVALTFHGRPKKGQTLIYLDGNQLNIHADNLRWEDREKTIDETAITARWFITKCYGEKPTPVIKPSRVSKTFKPYKIKTKGEWG